MIFEAFGEAITEAAGQAFNAQCAEPTCETHAVVDVFRPSRAAQRRVRLAEQRDAEDWPEEWSR